MLETLSGKFNVILRVTYVTGCYPLTLPFSEGLHISFCGLYNVVSANHSVQNSPWWGSGVYSHRKAWRITFYIFL